jgi:transcriptional regulator with XRE-family HTH domain
VPTRRAAALAQRRRERLAENVRRVRLSLGWTQDELAQQAGVDRKSINRLENAAYSPSVDRLFLVADALGVSGSALLDEGDG